MSEGTTVAAVSAASLDYLLDYLYDDERKDFQEAHALKNMGNLSAIEIMKIDPDHAFSHVVWLMADRLSSEESASCLRQPRWGTLRKDELN